MRKPVRVGLLLALTCSMSGTGTWAPEARAQDAAPATYEEWIKRAEDYDAGRLNPGLMDRDKNMAAKREQIALSYEGAAKLAPDDAKRYDALNKAAVRWSLSEDRKRAVALYSQMRELKEISPEQRKEAARNAAMQNFYRAGRAVPAEKNYASVRSDFEKLLALPNLTPLDRSSALDFVGDTYVNEGNFVQAGMAYERATAFDPGFSFNKIVHNIEKAPRSPEAAKVLLRAYPAAITAKYYDSKLKAYVEPSESDRRRTKARWAAAMSAQGESRKAVEIYNELLATAPEADKYEYQKGIATAYSNGGRYPDALKAWDAFVAAPKPSFERQRDRAYGRSEVYAAQKNWQAARAELQALQAVPGLMPYMMGDAQIRIADLWKKQRSETAATPANAATRSELEKGAIAALDKALAMPDVLPGVIYQAAIERAQIEVDGGRLAAAHPIFASARERVKNAAGHVRGLWAIETRLYRYERNYAAAIAALYLAAVKDTRFGAYSSPNKDEQALAGALLQEAFQAKKWDEASAIVSVMDSWGLLKKESIVFRAEIDLAAGRPEIARARLKELAAMTLTDAEKAKHAELSAKLPPAPAGAAPAAIPAPVKPPVLAQPVPTKPAAPVMDEDDDW